MFACGGDGSTAASNIDAGLDSSSSVDSSANGEDALVATDADSQTDASAVIPKGARVLGIDAVNLTQTQSFDDNLAFAKSVGTSVMPIHVTWSSIEPDSPADCATPGTYTDTVLSTLDTYAAAYGQTLSVTIGVVDTNLLVVPKRFQALAFTGDKTTSDLMICRFNAMLDFVFSKLTKSPLLSVQIGNELDAYPASSQNVTFWSSYYDFFAGTQAHAHTAKPGLKVGFTATWNGLTGNGSNTLSKAAYANLVNVEDIIGFTYYGIHDDFTVKPAPQVKADMDAVVALFPTKTFFVEEAGYPTDATFLGSTPAAQADFVNATFAAWDAHADHIAFLNFVRLADLSHADATMSAAGYGGDAGTFIAYLETLGMRTYQGQDKPAIATLKSATKARGFW
jgi:hypothetical protein